MATVHANIGSQYLAEEVAMPNQLRNYYESYVLIPNLGPLVYSKIIKKMKLIFNAVNDAIVMIEAADNYKNKYNAIPSNPYIPENLKYSASSAGASVEAGLNIEEAYSRGAVDKPEYILKSLNEIGYDVINSSPAVKTGKGDDEQLRDYRHLLSGFSRKNAVVSALVNDKLMLGDEGMVSEKLISSNHKERLDIITDSFMKIDKTIQTTDQIEAIGKAMTKKIIHDTQFANSGDQVSKMMILYLANIFDIYQIAGPSDFIDIVDSCEWAFVRKELVTIDLKKPLFRGPVIANSISPESELTLTETETRLRSSVTGNLQKTTDELKMYNSISSEIKNKLGTLFDYGSNLGQTMSEQGYTKDNMQSEKRSRIESALREVSRQNKAFTLTTENITTSSVREYFTEGKDPKFATTELSFEVFSPVEVKHYLEDIGAVWCPRIKNPFLGLRDSLNEYYQKTYSDYILENYVIDPLEPVPSYENVSRVTKNTTEETNPGTYVHTVQFSLTNNEIKAGYLFGEDIQTSFNQHCDWYENCYDQDDYRIEILSKNRYGGDTRVDVKVKYKVDNVTGNDPDRTWITVSIDKYKETEAYRQQLQQYKQTVNKINPARRNAVKAQARKYATLKVEELIRKHEDNIDLLKDYAFTSLIRKMFDNNIVEGNWSYYQGIIRSCIDWEKSRMDPEPAEVESLYRNELSPYHFLNVSAVRFFLIIKKDAEKVFFDIMKKVVDQNWKSLFDKVENYIKQQRKKFNDSPQEQKLLDSYDSELILGNHLEAVLSSNTFSE